MSLYDWLPIPAQNLACTAAGIQRTQRRYGARFHHALLALERSVAGPAEELTALQWRRLRTMLLHARANVPAYAELPPPVERADPADAIQATLARIEPLEKQRYREAQESFLARNLTRSRLVRAHTSGTTGMALSVWYTPEAVAEEYAVVWRMRREAGVGLDDRHLTFGGRMIVPFGQAKPPFWRHDWSAGQTLFSIFHIAPHQLPDYVEALHRVKASWVQGYPSALHLVGRAMLEAGRPLPPGRIRALFTSSESLLSFQRDTIEAAFGAPVWDRYGASEYAVSMTACARGLLHVDSEFCVVEVEPREETDEWVRGPLMVTGLANPATPFIRYRIGDMGTRSKIPCACGRPGDAYLEVDGRIEDYLETPDGRLIGRLDHIFKQQQEVREAQILQHSADELEVLVVTAGGWSWRSERSLIEAIRERVGPRMKIGLLEVDEIPREPNGKFRLVKSRIRPQAGRPN